jgi:hypothetical protein
LNKRSLASCSRPSLTSARCVRDLESPAPTDFFGQGLEELKGQLTDSKDMVAVLKAYAEKNKTVEEA